MDGILESIKKTIGGFEGSNHFDVDLVMFINTALSTLSQLGVEFNEDAFVEDDDTTWADLIPNDPKLLGFVKTYIHQKTKLTFDPPQSSALLQALKESINELECRINYHVTSSEATTV